MCPDEPVEANDEKSGEDRRKHPRAPLQLLIQYRFDTVEDFLAEYSTDISVGGIFLRTDHPREEGAYVYLQFTLKDGSRLIETLGRVVRVNPPGDPNRVGGMGIEFVNMDADSLAVIEQIVAMRVPAGA